MSYPQYRFAPRIDPRNTIINPAIKKQSHLPLRRVHRPPAFDLKAVTKALRRDCEASNLSAVEAALQPGRYSIELGPRLDAATLGPVLKLLIKHGRLATAESVLRQRTCDVGLDLLMQGLVLMPQTSGLINADVAVSFVQAIVNAAELEGDAYRCRSFLQREAPFLPFSEDGYFRYHSHSISPQHHLSHLIYFWFHSSASCCSSFWQRLLL